MKAAIIATGKEIMSGDIADTNTFKITKKLTELGIDVTSHHSIGDDEEKLAEIIDISSNNSDIIIVTGGLGPTHDDRTRFAAANLSGSVLVENKEAMNSVKAFFINRNIPMPEQNKIQAMLPENAVCITNNHGTAPAFSIQYNKTKIYFLPGVPFEMEHIFDSSVVDDIKSNFDLSDLEISKKFTLFGLPESEVGLRLNHVEDKFSTMKTGVKIGIQAVFPHIFVKIYIRGRDESERYKIMDDAENYLFQQFKEYIISSNGETLEETAGKLCMEKGCSLAIAESCTGGMISSLITDVSGSSSYFKFGAVTYSNESKINILGVDEDIIKNFGAVSKETAGKMAEGARRIGKTDIGLATTGIAGPTGATETKSVGTVCIGISTEKNTETFTFIRDFKDRFLNKKIFAAAALFYLIKNLKD